MAGRLSLRARRTRHCAEVFRRDVLRFDCFWNSCHRDSIEGFFRRRKYQLGISGYVQPATCRVRVPVRTEQQAEPSGKSHSRQKSQQKAQHPRPNLKAAEAGVEISHKSEKYQHFCRARHRMRHSSLKLQFSRRHSILVTIAGARTQNNRWTYWIDRI
jgi:hypothetical protein